MARDSASGRQLPQATDDARRVMSELTEMLAVLVAPALLLSGLSLFFI